MTDLVVASLEPWDAVWRRNQHLIAGLLRDEPGLRVLFVEPDVDSLDSVRRSHRHTAGRGLRRAPDSAGVPVGQLWLYESTKVLPRRINPNRDAQWANSVVRAARRVGMTNPVLWVNDPRGAEVLIRTGWPALYDITDDWTLADRRPVDRDRTRRHEDLLLERCAEVVVCSPALQASKGADRPVTLVPNGVDSAAYQRHWPRPADLPRGPVATYVGTLHRDRLDVDLCAATARTLPASAELVLVGPNALDPVDTDALLAAGVVILGARPGDTVPAYLRHADVLVVPHIVTPFTESLDPIKAYEYAAAARPVVATPVAGFRDTGSPLVAVATPEDFPIAVARSLTSTPSSPTCSPTVCISDLDWSHRVTAMRAVLERLASRATGAS